MRNRKRIRLRSNHPSPPTHDMPARLLLLTLSAALFTSLAHAENWPGWRGPRGDGTSLEGNPPLHWDAASGENIVWKAAIPGDGHSSPVIWNDRV
ncbi:MAG: hypothetical protein DWQ29_01080, partial [Planctomycetota bacterium]